MKSSSATVVTVQCDTRTIRAWASVDSDAKVVNVTLVSHTDMPHGLALTCLIDCMSDGRADMDARIRLASVDMEYGIVPDDCGC